MKSKESLSTMKRLLMALCAATMLTTGCATVKIRQVLNNPARYQGREVRLDGEVTRSTGLVVAGVYQIDDGTGKLNVLSTRPIPRQGSHVTVKGRVQSGVTVLSANVGTHLREDSVRIHN
jgi:hypothetical protein